MGTSWEILSKSFSLQTGELGQTGKVNRAFVADKYSRLINRMYTGESRRGSLSEANEREPQPYPHQLTNIVEEEERQGSRSSQDKDTFEEEVEPIEAGVSKVNSLKKVPPKIDQIEPGKPKKDHTVSGKTHMDHTEPREAIGETGNGALNEEEATSDMIRQPSEEPRNENETEREER